MSRLWFRLSSTLNSHQQEPMAAHWARRTIRSLVYAGIAGSSVMGVLYLSDSRAEFYKSIGMPLIHALLDPEESHRLAIELAKWKCVPRDRTVDPDSLKTTFLGLSLSNPIGLAAGFDKNAEAVDGLLGFGFGSVEIGSVTPRPQPGNPKPRMFRLSEDKAVINRYGFNSDGHEKAQSNLLARIHKFLHSNFWELGDTHKQYYPEPDAKGISSVKLPGNLPRSLLHNRILGVNLGKNKTSAAESNQDYIDGVKTLGPFADYLVVNVSSPNTPGLRSLQRREPMERLMKEVSIQCSDSFSGQGSTRHLFIS